MACNTLFDYPYFNNEFNVHTNAIDFELGAVISQKGKPIAFHNIKITDAQKRYTVTEKDLSSIVETLKLFRTILLGRRLRIYTDY